MTEQDKRKPARDEASPARDETTSARGEPVRGHDEDSSAEDSPDLSHGRPMPDPGEAGPGRDKASLAGEMEKMEYEPLLPIEKKLILWSIGLGVVLLVLLTWVSYTFFPAS